MLTALLLARQSSPIRLQSRIVLLKILSGVGVAAASFNLCQAAKLKPSATLLLVTRAARLLAATPGIGGYKARAVLLVAVLQELSLGALAMALHVLVVLAVALLGAQLLLAQSTATQATPISVAAAASGLR
jgi:hypothetical protein